MALEVVEEAIKHDRDKSRPDLITPDFIWELADVLRFGATKYSENNWRSGDGLMVSRCYAAAMRHMLAFWNGETMDQETGLSHISHATCNLMFIHWLIQHRPDRDDRWVEEAT